jgi:hypothetical protein
MAFWIEVDWARVAEDHEVRAGVAQGSGYCLHVLVFAATSLKRYSQGTFRVDTRGEPGTVSASGRSDCLVSADQHSCLRAGYGLGLSLPRKGYLYLHSSLDSITLAPLACVVFETNPFPIIIHA